MDTTVLGRMAADFEEVPVPANGGEWRMAWHPPGDAPLRPPGDAPLRPPGDAPLRPPADAPPGHPGDAPPGLPHGANAFCVTDAGEVVLISTDGSRWGWPGGRPEPGESWEDTLRREMLEEACAAVTGARLLGFVRSRCLSGHEQGRVLVRSIWRAEVRLLPWQPEYEIPFRRVVPARELARHLWMEDGTAPIYSRAAREAALV